MALYLLKHPFPTRLSSDLYAAGKPQINNKTRYSRNRGVRGAIFLPQQRERHALALDLPRNQRPVRLGQILRRTPDSPKEQPFKRRVIVIARDRKSKRLNSSH